MPPRRKASASTPAAAGGAAAAAPAPARPTRASARQKAASQSQADAASQPQPTDVQMNDDADDTKNGAATTSNADAKKAPAPNAKKAPASKAAASKPASKAAAPKPASKAAGKGKGKGKRTRDEVSDDEADGDAVKPESKKAKKDDTIPEDDEEDTKDDKADDVKPDDKDKAKMVTVIKRGAVPVDPCSGMVLTHQVYANAEGVWDAMLNQTDVGKNANKFYVVQLLHPVGNDSACVLFTRWGRVGENGQQQQKGPFPSSMAVYEFKKQFKAKAGTDWERRHNMVAKKGKYMWLERDYADDEEKDESSSKDKGKAKEEAEDEKIPDSQLSAEQQEVCRLIFNPKLLDAHLSSMNYDARKLPLGKLAKSTILNGFAALKTLSEVLADPNCKTATDLGGFRAAVDTLTGRYYSIIPHVFGRNRPTVIDDMTILKRELDLVDALGDMEIASKLIASTVSRDQNGNPLNPLDAHFRSLNLTMMDPVPRKSSEYDQLSLYVKNTHGATHHMAAEVLQAFRVERKEETDAFIKAGHHELSDGQRLLLWHGSRTTNFAGILKQGLRIAPPEAPVSGYMFGKGVYFADMMSKSANYCHAYLSDGVGLLLLAEVAAKPYLELQGANYNADQACKSAGRLCTKGAGSTQPNDWQDAGDALGNHALKGVHMPRGLPTNQQQQGMNFYGLAYNEYIVYDPAQIRLRYLLMVKMH